MLDLELSATHWLGMNDFSLFCCLVRDVVAHVWLLLHASAFLIPTHQHFTVISFAILFHSLVEIHQHFILVLYLLFCLHVCIHPPPQWMCGQLAV